MKLFAGAMLSDINESCTVRAVEAVTEFKLAEIVVVPLPALALSPCEPGVLLIVATVADEEAHVAIVVMFATVPSEYSPVAVNGSVPPNRMDGPCGLISMAVRVAVLTVKLPEPVIPPNVAAMTVVPAPVLAAIPLLPGVLLTVAAPGTDEVQ